ncbi:kinase-like domain-containing protein [Mycena latifolia]|nr:kinase-like domain-containing protein [Mycena latifolia]
MIAVTQVTTTLPSIRGIDQTLFLPVGKGEIFSGRYEALRNLGSGIHSTVWLVRDIRTKQEAAMKVMESSLTENDRGPDELGILSLLRDGNPQSLGKEHVCQLLDYFIHDGEAYLSRSRAAGYEYAHRVSELRWLIASNSSAACCKARSARSPVYECGIIHTDIKGANILMTGVGFADGQSTINLNVMDLFSTKSNKMTRQWAAVIQPVALRAPEILISAQADIWNFGCLVLISPVRTKSSLNRFPDNEHTGMDRTQTHLSQMAGLLGDFPKSFLARGGKTKDYFDERHLLQAGAYGITLNDLLSRGGHLPDELPAAVDFLSRALTIDPEDRWSAAQLLEHPWIQNII